MLKFVRKTPALLAIAAILCLSSASFADDYDDNDIDCTGDNCEEAGAALLTTTTAPTTTVAAGVAITVVLMMGGGGSASKETYIRQNALALQQDMTVGAGESVTDLAAAFQVSEQNLPAFAAAVHAHRAELLPLTDVSELNTERADAFFAIVATAMNQTPALRADLQKIVVAG